MRQAQRELRKIRNALEEYKIDHKTYPPEGSDLKVALAPYLSKAFYYEGKEVAEYMKSVLGAKNNLNQINNAISRCGKIKDVQIKETFDHIQELLKSYENVLLGKDEKILPLGGEISKLRTLIDNLCRDSAKAESPTASGDYYDFLPSVQKDMDNALKLVSILDEGIEKARESAVIVQAQESLHRMADALKNYRREKGKFPEAGENIDLILHPYFVETTMSGEQIDRWQNALSWFSSGPIYKTKDPNTEFELTARANNIPIISRVKVQNQWDEIIKVFDSPPIYTTPDSVQTYFLKARAEDSRLTWVTERPPIAEEKEWL